MTFSNPPPSPFRKGGIEIVRTLENRENMNILLMDRA
jgi:hypothetical protein